MTATVKQIRDITGSQLDNKSIQPFLDAAICFLEAISESVVGLSEICKDQIEVFLASHLLMSSPVGSDNSIITKESLRGKYSVEYLTPLVTGQGILSTTFGQMANALTMGNLAQLDKNPINIKSIGSL